MTKSSVFRCCSSRSTFVHIRHECTIYNFFFSFSVFILHPIHICLTCTRCILPFKSATVCAGLFDDTILLTSGLRYMPSMKVLVCTQHTQNVMENNEKKLTYIYFIHCVSSSRKKSILCICIRNSYSGVCVCAFWRIFWSLQFFWKTRAIVFVIIRHCGMWMQETSQMTMTISVHSQLEVYIYIDMPIIRLSSLTFKRTTETEKNRTKGVTRKR